MRYCAIFALFYFVSDGNFQVQALRDLFSEGRFKGGLFVCQHDIRRTDRCKKSAHKEENNRHSRVKKVSE